MAKRKGVSVNQGIGFMIGVFVMLILAFTWFFPTLNSSTGLNNSSTLWLGGTNYSWVVPLIAVVLAIALVVIVLKKGGLMGGN